MEITINEKKITWEPDFKTNRKAWKVKNTDAFCFLELGGYKCFVKRFEFPPPALQLLIDLKGKPVVNVSQVYDLVQVEENKKPVCYLFLECLEGKTLKEYIVENKNIDLKKLSQHILDGLKFIHKCGYWFGDFNEENIFLTKDKTFILIDLDSCWPHHVFPGPDPSAPGGLPGAAQYYANIVVLFYREFLNLPEFTFENVEGKNLNWFQLLALVAKLQNFLEHKMVNPQTAFVNKDIYKDPHYYLLNKNELYCRNIFEKALQNKLTYSMVLEYSKFITGEHQSPANSLPEINFFTASAYHVYSRGSSTLTWNVKNADEVFVVSAGTKQMQKVTLESTLNVKPTKTDTYSLTAVTGSGKKVTKSIQIDVTEIALPEIKKFEASTLKIKKGDSLTLSWLVAQASKLLVNDTQYDIASTGVTLNPLVSSSYQLIAENKAGEKAISQLTVEVVSKINALIIFLIVLLVVVAYLIWWFTKMGGI